MATILVHDSTIFLRLPLALKRRAEAVAAREGVKVPELLRRALEGLVGAAEGADTERPGAA